MARRHKRGIFHKAHRDPYHTENSLRGVERAAAAGWHEIDLDENMTADGVGVNTHWLRPLLHDQFRDPEKKISRFARVDRLTWAEVERLVAPNGYRIHTMERMLEECAKKHIGARIEPKADKRFESVSYWLSVKHYADHVGATVRGYSIRNLGGRGAGVRRVKAMNKAGIPSVPIH